MPDQTPSTTANLSKSVLRQQALQNRADARKSLGEAVGQAILDHFLADVPRTSGASIAGYFPIRSEADPIPLMSELGQLGHTCALPRVTGADKALRFFRWTPGDKTDEGAFGTQVPVKKAAEIIPDILLIPLVAFDLNGFRLGYGGGFYDRTLEALRAKRPCLAVGIAYSVQEYDTLPQDVYDQPLDWVVTEKGSRRF
ncbi:MAG: 5-formyltetrahydrofolate cyclo-ligase [Parvibaculum sp.]|jgi:5-formyltetrahydrofolate cyclo-ligase|nr:5-formyltetrahydrofolate cyclo-ligase [Parvibaculum sp.]|tara:strand:+ start:349 stop:942 length:594 start_codon:yes stop_codon:yes gene_type:complete